MTPLIKIENLVKNYSIGGIKNQILKEISLEINKGELLAIVGPSGSGKSTLMNIIGLLDGYDAGTYQLNQRSINELSDDDLAELRNQHIGFVFQQFNLLSRFSALQNVALPLIYRNLPPVEIHERVMYALSKVGMETFTHHRPMQLSGGQQQRIAIARALVGEPNVILADEPTGALDSKTGTEVLNLFLKLNEEGRTIILVTHDEHVAERCTRRITLTDGQIVTETWQ